MNLKSLNSLAVLSCSLLAAHTAPGQTLVSADFGTYTDGALVGQNNWLQYNTASGSPITVTGGKVGWAGGKTTDNQDAVLLFNSQIAAPAEGATVLHYDLVLRVTAAGANPSYFSALNGLNTTSTSQNFQNARLVARSLEDGFQFGTRVNGQAGYPFAYGTEKLAFNTDYAFRAEINMVAGNANDFIKLYVGPDFDNLSLYATAAYASGTVADPTFGGVLLSQFGSSTQHEAGVTISSLSVTIVPEPSSLALLAVGGLCLFASRRKRRQ